MQMGTRTVFHEMILRQAEQRRAGCQTLSHHEARGSSELLAFDIGPAIDIL